MKDVNERCDMAIAILRATNDGNSLYVEPEYRESRSPGNGWQLYLVQEAVNGHLNDRGWTLFKALHRQVSAGDYAYPVGDFIEKFSPELKGGVS